MKTFTGILTLVLVACLSACTASREGTSGQPTAEQTMEQQLAARNLAARGGMERLQQVQSLVMEGTARLPTMGMVLPLKIFQERPTRMLTEVEIPEMGARVLTGYDGETVWTINPMMGRRPQRLTGVQARDVREQADIDGMLIASEEKGYRLVYAGEDSVRERKAHRLRVIRPDTTESVVYLDAESGLVVKMESEGTNPVTGARVPVEVYMSDYRDVDGMTLPFAMETVMDGKTFQVVTLQDVRVNEDVDDARFAMPAQEQK